MDHQVGLYTGVRDIDILQLKHNVRALTRSLLALKVPVIVTTTMEKMWEPLIPELAEGSARRCDSPRTGHRHNERLWDRTHQLNYNSARSHPQASTIVSVRLLCLFVSDGRNCAVNRFGDLHVIQVRESKVLEHISLFPGGRAPFG